MRIIGGHDYYDSGLAFGQDDTILFLRNGERRYSVAEMTALLVLPRTVCSGTLTQAEDQTLRSGRDRDVSSMFARHAFKGVTDNGFEYMTYAASVLFCGTLYNGVHIESRARLGYGVPPEDRWIWSADAFRAYAAEHGLGISEGKNGATKDWLLNVRHNREYVDVEVQDIETWFAPVTLAGVSRDRVIENKITIASYIGAHFIPGDDDGVQRPWLVDQATLGGMGFAKAVDPFTAFQEISMWKGGVLGSDAAPMVEITDNKVKIEKHGFDNVTSFRRGKAAT